MNAARTLARFCLLSLIAVAANESRAAILFEGYSKVLLAGTHVGFVVERYDFDEKKNEFGCAYFLKTSTADGTIMESLRARSTTSLEPISYNYTSLVKSTASSIDATFKKGEMTLKIREGNKVSTRKTKVKKGVFLSRFLVYLMLSNKEGIKTGSKYSYDAIAEEDGKIYPGETIVQSRETVLGESAFKLKSKFKEGDFIGYVTAKGETLSTDSPSLSLKSELVANPEDATKGQGKTAEALKLVFGNVPEGKENALARRTQGLKLADKATTAKSPKNEAAIDGVTIKQNRLNGDAEPKEPREPREPFDASKGSDVPGGNGMALKPIGGPERAAKPAPDGDR